MRVPKKQKEMKMRKIRLFMASPSDTSEERKAFASVVQSINRSRAEKAGFHLAPILWEEYAYPEAENPQAIINKLLADAELVIVVFWNKFGAPTKRFPSGTMEELFLSLNKRKTTGWPSIKIYFRTPLPPRSMDDIEELKRIFETKESLKDLALYKEYPTVEEFKGLLQEHINAWLSDYGSKKQTRERKIKPKVSKSILNEPSDCKGIIKDVFKKLEKKYDGEKSRITFGVEDLDDALGEIEDNNLLIVAGDMTSGKTALMLTLAYNAAVINRVPTLYFTTRSNKEDIGRILLCSISQTNIDLFKKGFVKKDDWHKLVKNASQLIDAPLFFDDNLKVSVDEIREQVSRLKRSIQIGLIIVDEINYLIYKKAKIGKKLRILSRDLKLPIVATVYLENPKRRPSIPMLMDLDPMGDLKKEADTIIFSHRPQRVSSGLSKNTIEVIIAKNKNGPCLTFEKYYMPAYCGIGRDIRDDGRDSIEKDELF